VLCHIRAHFSGDGRSLGARPKRPQRRTLIRLLRNSTIFASQKSGLEQSSQNDPERGDCAKRGPIFSDGLPGFDLVSSIGRIGRMGALGGN